MSGKIDKYEYFTGEVMLPSEKGRMVEQAKYEYLTGREISPSQQFTCSSLRKAFEIQRKVIEIEAEKQKKRIDNATVKQTKAIEISNTDKQLKSIDYVFSKQSITKQAKVRKIKKKIKK